MGKYSVELSTEAVVDLPKKTLIQVLHVDDEADFLRGAKEILEMQGAFQVDTASSVEEAMEKATHKSYDAVVSDYMMPGKSGLEFLKELRESGDNIPFIIFTGKGREIVAIKALNLGADLYVNKIGNPEAVYSELANGIRKLVEAERAEKALEESEEKWRTLAEHSPSMIFVNIKGRVVYANKKCEEIMGYKKDEFYSSHFDFYTLISPESREKVIEAFKKHMNGEEVETYEYALVTKEGKKTEAIITTKLIEYDGETAILGIITDITERKKAAEALQESERKFRLAFENAKDAIFWANPETGSIINCNKAAETLLEKNKGEILGHHQSQLHPPQKAEHYLDMFKRHIKQKGAVADEAEIITKSGKIKPVHITASVTSVGENPIIQGIFRDVSERKRAEQALQESQRKFEGLFRDNPEAAVYIDPKFQILDVNPRFEQLFGYSLEEVKGKRLLGVIVPEDRVKEGKMLNEKAKKGHVYYDTVRKRKDSSLVSVSISAAPITVEGRLIGYVRLYKDISELKKAQQQLEESQRHFQALFNLMVDPVAIVDKKGKILAITDKVERITGFKKEELVGKNFLRTKIASAKTKAIMMKNLAKRMMGIRLEPYEVEILTKDGRRLSYEINAETIDYKGKLADMVVFRDISKRKNLETKLRVVGKLARHDARNKLSVVTMNTFLARKKLSEDHEVLQHLSEIESAVGDVERIFDFAGTYEVLGMEKSLLMDVEKTLEETVRLFPELQGVDVVNECRGLTVRADSLLRQLFYNLIHNSLKHGKKVTRIRVYYETGKDQLKLVYGDNGVGIPKAEKDRIFVEGYGKGTGFGLYLIRKMCEVYGWSVRETGEYCKGAEFTITIPEMDKNGKTNYQLSRSR